MATNAACPVVLKRDEEVGDQMRRLTSFSRPSYFLLLIVLAYAEVLFGGAVITLPGGAVSIGVNDQGHLIFGGVGLTLTGLGDALTPGCDCEAWGVSGNGIVAYAGQVTGISNLTVDSFSSTATTATSATHPTTLPALSVTHAYAPSSGSSASLFAATVTITNTGGSTITNVRYSRAMDWDVPPTEFSEFVTIQGLPAANLLFSNDNGFATPNPLINPGAIVGGTNNVNFTDVGPADHGAFFTFGFGDLAAGASVTFTIFYGATTSEAAALAALTGVSAEIYSFGQSNGGQITGSPGTFIFAFKGVGGTPIGGGGGCPHHTSHGHTSTVPANHIGNVSGQHHGQHGHTIATGCPTHGFGHTPGLMPETGVVFNPEGLTAEIFGAVNEDGSLNGNSPAVVQAVGAPRGPAKRGTVLQLFATAGGLSNNALPEVYIGDVRAKVLFSGPAPKLDGAWQINVLIPDNAPVAPAVHVRVLFGGYELPSIDIGIE